MYCCSSFIPKAHSMINTVIHTVHTYKENFFTCNCPDPGSQPVWRQQQDQNLSPSADFKMCSIHSSFRVPYTTKDFQFAIKAVCTITAVQSRQCSEDSCSLMPQWCMCGICRRCMCAEMKCRKSEDATEASEHLQFLESMIQNNGSGPVGQPPPPINPRATWNDVTSSQM